ncbi:MAG: HlyD family efflux transporter periplasmic adaptor subunit [Gammaproteobacteria bacterium]|nr:HlyD family efflux transporter periplasmic adaptor subunit [Gammaproteobacteria bacterium]
MNAEGIHAVETKAKGVTGDAAKNKEVNPRSQGPLHVDLAQDWLAWQCRMVAGIIRGAIYLPADAEHLDSAISIWPGEGEGESQLIDAASQALTENRGVTLQQQYYGPGDRRICDLVACPLLVENEMVAVVAVMISTRSESQQHAVLQLLQWGGLWMETLVRQQKVARLESAPFSLTLMTAILGHSSSHTAAIEAVNLLADQFQCERVSIGFREGLPIRLRALSHVASFDPRTQLVRRIEAAMEEAVDQITTVVQPGTTDHESAVTRAHVELSEQQGNGSVCTIPLLGQSEPIGAVTLERVASQPFDKDTVVLCESLAGFIGLALEMKQRDERSFWSRGIEAVLNLVGGVFGMAYLKLKIALLSAIALVAALSLIDGNHEVTAPASIEGSVRQLLVAPQEGYVKQAEVRAGDSVKKGQLIALLDDRNLQLEHQKWQSERNKVEKEYQDALAKRNRTELSILRAQLDQVDAELRLVEEKIARTRLRTPFDGVVVSGDLSQSLGAPVKIGQVLFEVAPLHSYRVVLEVDDHDVAGLDTGKSGHLIIAALPQSSFAFSVDQVVPVAVSSEAGNFFRVEASLDEPSTLLRPGMRGVAKVGMGQHKLLWIWTHAFIDRIRLWIWSAGL